MPPKREEIVLWETGHPPNENEVKIFKYNRAKVEKNLKKLDAFITYDDILANTKVDLGSARVREGKFGTGNPFFQAFWKRKVTAPGNGLKQRQETSGSRRRTFEGAKKQLAVMVSEEIKRGHVTPTRQVLKDRVTYEFPEGSEHYGMKVEFDRIKFLDGKKIKNGVPVKTAEWIEIECPDPDNCAKRIKRCAKAIGLKINPRNSDFSEGDLLRYFNLAK